MPFFEILPQAAMGCFRRLWPDRRWEGKWGWGGDSHVDLENPLFASYMIACITNVVDKHVYLDAAFVV